MHIEYAMHHKAIDEAIPYTIGEIEYEQHACTCSWHENLQQ